MAIMCKFLRRHKNKLATCGLLAATAYASVHALKWKLSSMFEEHKRCTRIEAERSRGFNQAQAYCRKFIDDVMKRVAERVTEECGAADILTELKSGVGVDKRALWERLKVATFTELATLCYVTAAVTCVASVQWSVTAALLLRDGDGASSGEERHKFLVRCMQKLTMAGGCDGSSASGGDVLHDLINCVRRSTNDVMGQVSLREPVTYATLRAYIDAIIVQVTTSGGQNVSEHLAGVILPPGGDAADAMCSDAWDVMTSSDFDQVLWSCVKDTVERACGDIVPDDETADSLEDEFGVTSLGGEPTSVVMAKLIPLVNKYSSGWQHSCVLVSVNDLCTLAENVFESFVVHQ